VTEFDIKCECGRTVRVSIGQAGSTVACRCLRDVRVPSSIKLREMANLAPVEPEPELVLQSMYNNGELDTGECLLCAGEAVVDHHLLLVCEQQFARNRGSDAGQYGIIAGFAGSLLASAAERRRNIEILGRDVTVPVRLSFCAACYRAAAPRRAGRWTGVLSGLCLVLAIVWLLMAGAAAALWAFGAFIAFAIVAFINRRLEQARVRGLVLRRAEYKDLFRKYPKAVVVDRG
jgi:hypothetical protein